KGKGFSFLLFGKSLGQEGGKKERESVTPNLPVKGLDGHSHLEETRHFIAGGKYGPSTHIVVVVLYLVNQFFSA
ncbi:MAG: hypothetical protein U9P79_05990, partial [Candidatus Cloacimonadota bacterium]|nr:hypothetical protein [Candidatus Cloacimonadota bacterium]